MLCTQTFTSDASYLTLLMRALLPMARELDEQLDEKIRALVLPPDEAKLRCDSEWWLTWCLVSSAEYPQRLKNRLEEGWPSLTSATTFNSEQSKTSVCSSVLPRLVSECSQSGTMTKSNINYGVAFR